MKTLFAVVLGLLAVVLFVWLIKAPIVAHYLTNKMKVPVSLSSLSIGTSKAVIRNFRINNPRGFHSKAAFKAEEIEVNYRPKAVLFFEPAEIDLIDVRDIFLSIELKNLTGSDNNWTAIAAKMPKEESKKELLIHKLVLTNMTVEIRGLGIAGKNETKKIDRLEFDEIDSREGFPTKQLIQAIFQGAGIQDYIQQILNPQNVIKKMFFSENEARP